MQRIPACADGSYLGRDVCDWFGLAGDASTVLEPQSQQRTSWLQALGNPSLILQLVAIPFAAYEAAVVSWEVTTVLIDGTADGPQPHRLHIFRNIPHG